MVLDCGTVINIPHLKNLKLHLFNIESEDFTWHFLNNPRKQQSTAAHQAMWPGLSYKGENIDNNIEWSTRAALFGQIAQLPANPF